MKFKKKISVIGLGYVGLPLANRLSKYYNVVGFDTNSSRIQELKAGIDRNNDVDQKILVKSKIFFTQNIEETKKSDFFIVTVPTPVDQRKKPNLKSINSACKLVAPNLKKGSIVIFESTVYPGLTEEICKPILENYSKLSSPTDFGIGYSPERINPGDTKHSVEKITKVVSGSNIEISKIIGDIYKTIIKAGVFYAKSIEIAETAKAIENAQRDINIAFVNEIALLCQKLNISVYDVLDAAKTKWNFLPFQPGLVGGHCIGVDPYYLAHIAKKVGAKADIILSGRRLNEQMTSLVFNIIEKKISSNDRILQIGISFKENVPDTRNSKAVELAKSFIDKNYNINVYDTIVDSDEVNKSFGIKLSKLIGRYDVIIIAVSHKFLTNESIDLLKYIKKSSKIFDITGKYRNMFSSKNIKYWSL